MYSVNLAVWTKPDLIIPWFFAWGHHQISGPGLGCGDSWNRRPWFQCLPLQPSFPLRLRIETFLWKEQSQATLPWTAGKACAPSCVLGQQIGGLFADWDFLAYKLQTKFNTSWLGEAGCELPFQDIDVVHFQAPIKCCYRIFPEWKHFGAALWSAILDIETPSMMEEKCGLEALRLGTINRQKNNGWRHYNNKECYIYIPICMRMQEVFTVFHEIWSELVRSGQIWSNLIRIFKLSLPAIASQTAWKFSDQICSELPDLVSSVRSKSNQIPSRIWTDTIQHLIIL